jgi:thioredoxin reductase
VSNRVDVAIVGAGPYGLSLAHYLDRRGVTRRVFGQPMQFWRSMPPGMFLKSFGFATSIPAVGGILTLPEYCRARNLESQEPISIGTFAEYGLDFQARLVRDVVPALVQEVRQNGNGFEILTTDGESCLARQVVVATGLSHFEVIAQQLAHLPPQLVSHTGRHSSFAPFAGRDVTVIGGGQSALQAAALLHEAGARTRILARESIIWHTRMSLDRPFLDRLRNPNSVLGASRKNWVLQHFQGLFPLLPEERRIRFTRGHLGPSGAWWLRDRVEGVVEVAQDAVVTDARELGGRVHLSVRSGGVDTTLDTDHVIAGTGYEVDVNRLSFLPSELRAQIALTAKAPRLSRTFESSVPGLYFIGPASALTFGPIARFVAGAPYASATLARHLPKYAARARAWVSVQRATTRGEPTRVHP